MNQIFNDDPFAAPANEYRKVGTMRIYDNLTQGSDEWLKARLGILTASEMKRIVTPATIKAAKNDTARAHLYEIAAQRITQHVEPSYINDDMMRGWEDEELAVQEYAKAYGPIMRCGFVVNDKWGFKIGCSPDALVGDDGGWECKSRRAHLQVKTILEHMPIDGGEFDESKATIPGEFAVQVQTSLLVTERSWWDFTSYSGGLPMITIRVYPDPEIQNAIVEIAGDFERQVQEAMRKFDALLNSGARMIPTERVEREEMHVG